MCLVVSFETLYPCSIRRLLGGAEGVSGPVAKAKTRSEAGEIDSIEHMDEYIESKALIIAVLLGGCLAIGVCSVEKEDLA